MTLAKLSGPLKLGAVSGDIDGTQLTGLLDLNTVSGRVHLTKSNFPSADASTVSGDLTLETPVAEGPYRFSSVSGSVRMLVPVDTRCNVELNSVSGSIRSSLPASATSMGHGLKITQIQGGGTTVRLKERLRWGIDRDRRHTRHGCSNDFTSGLYPNSANSSHPTGTACRDPSCSSRTAHHIRDTAAHRAG